MLSNATFSCSFLPIAKLQGRSELQYFDLFFVSITVEKKKSEPLKNHFIAGVFSLLLFVVQASSYAQENVNTYLYQVIMDDVVSDSVEWKTYDLNDTIVIVTHFGDVQYMYLCNPDFSVCGYNMEKGNGDYLHVRRVGENIKVEGMKEGEPIYYLKPAGDTPWYQNLGWAPTNMLLQGKEKCLFTFLRPDNFSEMSMKAEIVDYEDLIIRNRSVNAVKVRVSLTGFLQHFWSGYYWYRRSDCKMLKYSGNSGPPGSPRVKMLLIDEYIN